MAGKVGLLKSVGDTSPGYVWLFGENQIKVDHVHVHIPYSAMLSLRGPLNNVYLPNSLRTYILLTALYQYMLITKVN